MDELFNTQPMSPLAEAWHNEQRRKQYDVIRVKNPTNADFYVMYDTNQYQKVPANSNIDIPRFIAERYIKHMKDKIINDMNQEKHDTFIADRRKKGFPEYKDKSIENNETYMTAEYPRIDDPVVMPKIIDELWIGLVHEFGRDRLPTQMNPRSGEVDLTPPEQKVMERLNSRRVDAKDMPQTMYQAAPAYLTQTSAQTIPEAPSGFTNLNQKLSASDITQE